MGVSGFGQPQCSATRVTEHCEALRPAGEPPSLHDVAYDDLTMTAGRSAHGVRLWRAPTGCAYGAVTLTGSVSAALCRSAQFSSAVRQAWSTWCSPDRSSSTGRS